MARWSRQQDDVLWEHGHEGVERCAEIIGERFGVVRTAEAVRRHAYRIGAPVIVYEICPTCGRKVDYLGRYGVCNACRARDLADAQRRKRDELLAEIRTSRTGGDVREAEREYARERQANARLRRKHGLPADKGKTRSGDSVKSVTRLSNA